MASSTGFQPVPDVPQVNNLRYGCVPSSTGFQPVPGVPQVENLRYGCAAHPTRAIESNPAYRFFATDSRIASATRGSGTTWSTTPS